MGAMFKGRCLNKTLKHGGAKVTHMADKKKSSGKKKSGSDKKKSTEGLNIVRGGSICDPKAKGPHVLRGSLKPAVCRTTQGPDPRPRWRRAGG